MVIIHGEAEILGTLHVRRALPSCPAHSTSTSCSPVPLQKGKFIVLECLCKLCILLCKYKQIPTLTVPSVCCKPYWELPLTVSLLGHLSPLYIKGTHTPVGLVQVCSTAWIPTSYTFFGEGRRDLQTRIF